MDTKELEDTYTDLLESQPKPIRRVFYRCDERQGGGTFDRIYAERCSVFKTFFFDSVLNDCQLGHCTLINCILTSGPNHWTTHCDFQNCQILGTEEWPYDLTSSSISNCKIDHGWGSETQSLKDQEARNRVAAQAAAYEVFNRVLLTEVAVDYLRRWAWRTKRRLRIAAKARDKRAGSMGSVSDSDSTSGSWTALSSPSSDGCWSQISPIREGSQFKDATIPRKVVPVDCSDRDILPVWSAKKAGKRPFHVNELYYVEPQLELSLARTLMWDMTKERKAWKFAESYGGEMAE